MIQHPLDGRIVLITGAGSGIGRSLAVQCRAAGATLVLAGRTAEALEETAGLAGPGPHTLLAADVAAAEGRGRLRTAVDTVHGRLDVLVNNAGTSSVGPLATETTAATDNMIATNLAAPIHLVRDLLPLLQASPSKPWIVNIGSMFGDIAYPLFATYSATKFGLRGFSDALRRELADSGIGVTYVAPRATRTPALARFQWLVEPFGMTVDPVERVAAQIVRAIVERRRTSYPVGLERLFLLAERLLPRLVDREIRRQLTLARPFKVS